jgi:3-oxoacyl-[acyl-carrier protein] reductase
VTVLVTGGSKGIGLAVSRRLAERGDRVAIAGRDRGPIDQALGSLSGAGHLGLELNVADGDAWPQAMRTLDAAGPLQGLVCAAGVLGPIGRLEDLDMNAVRAAIEINLLGTMLALHHAFPRLRAAGGRAVTFSGGGATGPLPRYDAYAVGKAAVVRLTENVEGVEINAVAPGFVATGIHAGTLDAGPEASGSSYYERTREQLQQGGFPAAEAAELVCMLLSPRAAGISGRLISAQWDPWRDDAFLDRLRTDETLGTLRRIDGQLFGPIDA